MQSAAPYRYRSLFMVTGLALALLLYFLNPFSVQEPARRVLAVAGLMVTWWITEALPMPAVALLPLVLFPLLGINGMKQTAASYGNEVIFLFMGGFMLGLAIEKWSLHRRIALSIVSRTGTGGNRIILGFVISTGLLSMWLSNTATTMMMFPIALSVVKVMKENGGSEGHFRNFTIGLLLAIAYASNFGGLSTIIGTPPNVQFVAFFEDRYGVNIGFLDWMLLCTPLAFSLMFIFYFITTRWLFPNRIRNSDSAQRYIRDQLTLLGPLRPAEKRVLFVFLSTVLLWITKDLINQSQSAFRLDDNMIAIAGALGLFLCPSGEGRRDEERSPYLLEWDDTGKMAWGILLLFGGGIALADALEKAGLIQQLGQWMAHYAGTGAWLLVTIVVVSVFLSEVMSNVAQVIVFSPVVCSLAEAMGMNPLLLGIPMTLAASCASMLPMGTPPNAIVFASGHLRLKDMVRAGLVMNVVAIVLISALCWWLLPVLIRVG